jgi:hypothetical protein
VGDELGHDPVVGTGKARMATAGDNVALVTWARPARSATVMREMGSIPGMDRHRLGDVYRPLGRSLEVLSQLPDRGAEVGLDAVGLLEAALEQQLGERQVLRTAESGEERLQPGANSSSSGRVATSTSFLMPATANLSKAAIRRAKASVKASISASGMSRFT